MAGRLLVALSRLIGATLLLCALEQGLPAQYARGITLAGPEFTESELPGVEGQDYTFNSEASVAFFAERRLNLIRVPIRWERLQPELFGPLNEEYLGRLIQNVEWAKHHQSKVIIDLHNYGRYKAVDRGILRTYVIDNYYNDEILVPAQALVDVWVKLSRVFESIDTVYAYGLMNEPHDMGSADWKSISQAVVEALRGAGDHKLLMIAGDSWSSAERWEQTHGPQAWIDDPARNHAYEAHIYFDADASGRYEASFDAELQADPDLLNIGLRRLEPFRLWCERNDVRCYLGEFGVPDDDERWLEALERFMTALDESRMDATYWAAGEMWGDYPLSVQPTPERPNPPQLAVLERHLGVEHLTLVSAASFQGGVASPGSLVSAFGVDLSSQLLSADALPLPEQLGETRVVLTDLLGRQFAASLIFVGPTQANFLLPENAAFGRLEATVWRGDRIVASGTIEIQPSAPALFAANGDGKGAPAALLTRVAADGRQEVETLAVYDPGLRVFRPRPIRFGAGERVFVSLFGTGFGSAQLSQATVMIGDAAIEPLFIGPQSEFPGLDQVNLELPRELAETATAELKLVVAQRESNSLTIQFAELAAKPTATAP